MKSVNSSQRLLEIVDSILDQHSLGISEYDLIVELDRHYPDIYPKPDLSDPLLLFQHHFYLRHTLYRLKQAHAQKGEFRISIDLIHIQKYLAHQTHTNLPDNHDPLCEYYLDLTNLNKEDTQSVQTMLSNFWHTLLKHQQQPEALSILGLNGDESQQQKQQRYRQLAQQHHPDKGGDPQRFREIQDAWQALKK